MKTVVFSAFVLWVSAIRAAQPALTIYNQRFAVVRDTVPLDLKSGITEVRFAGVTTGLEPESVMLRDPSGKHSLEILEQNYRNDSLSQEYLMSLFEGKSIKFENSAKEGGAEAHELISGKIIRSGYLPGGGAEQPIIEVDGKLQFRLPGQPLFPGLGDDTILRPRLNWLLRTDKPGRFDAEVSYISSGFTWQADYNLISPEKGGMIDAIRWITLENQSGKTFDNANLKLMAGDVNKILPMLRRSMGGFGGGGGGAAPVSEKSFDEYHLYTLARPTTLHDRQMKQVEFLRADGVESHTLYAYDGVEENIRFSPDAGLNEDRNFGTRCNKKVSVLREFVNSETNHLGIALPKGRLRFYRRDDNGQLEFIGQDIIDHTPRDETVRVSTGNAFDLVGERKQTMFKINISGNGASGSIDPTTGLPLPTAAISATNAVPPAPWIDESFEISLRNHKKEPVAIRVIEHLYRWSTWTITESSQNFKKIEAQLIEFPVTVKPNEEKKVTYTVHYFW